MRYIDRHRRNGKYDMGIGLRRSAIMLYHALYTYRISKYRAIEIVCRTRGIERFTGPGGPSMI